MRRTLLLAVTCWTIGFCSSTAAAFGYTTLSAWRDLGDYFQMGYVVGYLDAVTVCKRRDVRRCYVPTGGKKTRYEMWRERINEFYADPANAKKQLPDAMGAVGAKLAQEILERNTRLPAEQTPRGARSPAESSSPATTGTP